MRFLSDVFWEKGEWREQNQDAVVLLTALTGRGRVLLAAVCDGMGGHSGGEVASALVTRQLQEWFYDTLLPSVRRRKRLWVIRRSLDRLVYQMQACFKGYAQREQLQLGTTMSVLVIWEQRYLLWHLGDSRIYRVRRKRRGQEAEIVCLTQDHKVGSSSLTRCVGSFGFFCPDHSLGTVRAEEGFLICSDGFYRRMEEGELGGVLAPQGITGEEQIGRRLREIAGCCRRRGERDNLSAVYVRTGR